MEKAAHEHMETRMALMEKELRDMKHYLYGNGKPGKLATIEDKLDKMNNELWKLRTAVVIVAAGGGGAVGAVVHALFGAG